MSMTGKINHFLCLNIRQIREENFINQDNYKQNLLENIGMTNYTKVEVPMVVGTCLSPSLDKPAINLKTYRSMIGSLLYLTASQPDIMFFVCIMPGTNRTQENPIL